MHETTGNSRYLKCIDPSYGTSHRITLPNSRLELEKKVYQVFKIHSDANIRFIELNSGEKISLDKIIQDDVAHVVYIQIYGNSEVDPLRIYDSEVVTFNEKLYGMTIREDGKHIVVKEFVNKPNGDLGRAESSRQIRIGDAIRKIDGTVVTGCNYPSVIQYLKSSKRPIDIEFFLPKVRNMINLYPVEFTMKNLGITISYNEVIVFIKKVECNGYAAQHNVKGGDIVHAVQGEVISGNDYERVVELIRDSGRPLLIVFRKPQTPMNLKVVPVDHQVQGSQHYSPDRISLTSDSSTVSRQSTVRGDICTMTRGSLPSPRDMDCEMDIEQLVEYCKAIKVNKVINEREEQEIIKLIHSGNRNIKRAIQSKNNHLLVALIRSPYLTTWNRLLYRGEALVIAGVVQIKRKDYRLLVTSDPQLIFVNALGSVEMTIRCRQILGLKQFSTSEFSIDTIRKRYLIVDAVFGAAAWISIIKQYIVLQGYLTVESRRGRFFSKKRYFMLEERNLRYYKRQSELGEEGKSRILFHLEYFDVDVVDHKGLSFRITSIGQSAERKSAILVASTIVEFSCWVGALKALQRESLPR